MKIPESYGLNWFENICATGNEPTQAKMFIEVNFVHSINECVSQLEVSFLDRVQTPERGGG